MEGKESFDGAMIKVFRNRVYLYTFTTAILSLLQNGRGVCANAGEPYNITVVPVYPGARVSGLGYDNRISGRHIHGNLVSGSRVGSLSGLSGERGDSGSIQGVTTGKTDKVLSGEGGDREGGNYVYKYDKLRGKTTLYKGLYYLCDDCEEDTINSRSYKITSGNVSQYPSNTAITVKGKNAAVKGKNVTVSSEVSDKSFTRGVFVSEHGKIVLTNPIIKNAVTALNASNGTINVHEGTIEASHRGVEAIGNNAVVILEDTEVKTSDGKASISSYGGAGVLMNEGSVDFTNSHGVSSTLGGVVTLEGTAITGKGKAKNQENFAGFFVDVGGSVKFKGTADFTDVHGILSENTVNTFNSVPISEDLLKYSRVTEVNLTSSSVTVNGDTSYGIYFRGEKPRDEYRNNEDSNEQKTPPRLEAINLRRTKFSVPDSIAVYSTDATYGVVNLMQSELSGDSLLRVEKGALVKVLASASVLEGGAYVDDHSTAELYLGVGSKWILKERERSSPESGRKNDSSVSLVLLTNDSSIDFKKPKSALTYDYQTLRIGNGVGEVYRAKDGAHIYLNTYLNEGGALKDQKTDRLLIHGDAAGKTTVHVRSISESPGGYTGNGGNDQGISIIQVSGTANEDSFQLDGGYVALHGTPYQYKLYAYGPESTLGGSSSHQRLVKGDGDFWDFRLENQYLDSGPRPEPEPEPEGPVEPGVKDVVPQVPTYLLLPNSFFHAGLVNISNQNKHLERLRATSGGMSGIHENPALFLRGYAGHYRYSSNLSALEYGYGGELGYNALEAGVLLKTIENAYSNTFFGVIGAYERLSLQPLAVEQSQKSAFDKWSVTAYGTMQYDAGFYVDGLLSYGLFKGDVLTLARGKTATLKGNPLSVSLTGGQPFATGYEGFVFDPQVQVVYQHLRINPARDIDNFEIELGKLDQWTMRVGGRLTKTFPVTDEARLVSFYSKFYLAHGFDGKQSVHFKDAFQLGAFGSSLEAGLGFNARLSSKFALHGDLVYQHKLSKAGFSGTSFVGGLRYQF